MAEFSTPTEPLVSNYLGGYLTPAQVDTAGQKTKLDLRLVQVVPWAPRSVREDTGLAHRRGELETRGVHRAVRYVVLKVRLQAS